MNRFEQVKAFVKEHKTEILVASGVLAGVVIGGTCVHMIENRELYEMQRAFKKFNLEHGNKAKVIKIIGVRLPDEAADELAEEARKISDGVAKKLNMIPFKEIGQ